MKAELYELHGLTGLEGSSWMAGYSMKVWLSAMAQIVHQAGAAELPEVNVGSWVG